MQPHDNCDSCGEDYEFSSERDFMCLFLRNPECTHVLATCPHCGNEERIFVTPESVLGITEECHLPFRLYKETPAEILRIAAELFGFQIAEEDDVSEDNGVPDPYAPPRDWLIELWNDLRHFGGECGGCQFRQVVV